MKRTLLAVPLAFAAFAFARADEGAYRSLIGMAQSAKTDRGPDAGSMPERAADRAALKDAVAQPLAPKPRLWTRLYATLLPSWRRAPPPRSAFETAVSTVTVRVSTFPAPVTPSGPESVEAGERRGLAELLSASAAPTGGQ